MDGSNDEPDHTLCMEAAIKYAYQNCSVESYDMLRMASKQCPNYVPALLLATDLVRYDPSLCMYGEEAQFSERLFNIATMVDKSKIEQEMHDFSIRKRITSFQGIVYNILGLFYLHVLGDCKRAVSNFEISTANNCVYGQYNYGICLYHGLGIHQDKTVARTILDTAAKKGHRAAQTVIM